MKFQEWPSIPFLCLDRYLYDYIWDVYMYFQPADRGNDDDLYYKLGINIRNMDNNNNN